ncbi:MAG: trypsin-like peptidase domain-containing protein, partial [Christensenella hongkongensis]
MKKIICVLLIAVVLLTGSAALAANVPKPVLDARESTVYIEVENDEGVFSGSGFAIGTADTIEYVVTNHHVIEGDNGTFTVYFGEYDSVNAAVEIDLPDIDACVLKLDTPISGMRPLVLYAGEPDKLTGERVYALGFPGSADSIFDRTGNVGQDVTITDGIISAVKESFAFGTGERSATGLQMNASIFGGNSGGPLINENGVVAGINTFSSTQDSNLYGSLCISELLPSLDKKGIPYKASSNPLYSGMLWIYIIIAAAAVLFLLWFFKLRKMRHTKKQKTISFNEYLEKAGGILDHDFASRLLTPVARQVAELQRNGKCSLSIYPQNIRVRPETGEASLLPAKKQTLANGYSAPEQYKEFSQLGTWTDVYQLGALFYRVLTGERLPEVMARLEDDSHTQQKIESLTLSDPEKKALK